MGQVLFELLKISLRISFWATCIFTFLAVITLAISTIFVSLNGTVLMDLYFLIQMWLPFNFNIILTWTFTAVLAFFAYRVALWVYSFVSDILGNRQTSLL